MKITAFYIGIFFISIQVFAQNETRQASQKDATIKNEIYSFQGYGVNFNTNAGLIGGLVYRNSKAISTWNNKQMNRYWSVELVNVKHPKEKSYTYNLSSIIDKKMNYLFVVRPQYGREILLFKKYGSGSIGLSALVAGGLSLGLEKPYFIKYKNSINDNNPQTVPYDPTVHTNQNFIVGSGSILQGLGDSKIIPGINLKIGVNVNTYTFGNSIAGFEIGLLGEWFSRKPAIMAFAENQQLFTSAYLTIYFGGNK